MSRLAVARHRRDRCRATTRGGSCVGACHCVQIRSLGPHLHACLCGTRWGQTSKRNPA